MTPRVGERCFVPHTLWPKRAVVITRYGAGWLATVTKVAMQAVRFVCDGDDGYVELTRVAFREHCGLVDMDPGLDGVWRRLDSNSLGYTLALCDLRSLLALEATHRAALMAVRDWLCHPWPHSSLTHTTCVPSGGGSFLATGTVRGAINELTVWSRGERAATFTAKRRVAVVAMHPSGAVAWSCATETRCAPIFVGHVNSGHVHSYRPCLVSALQWGPREILLIGEGGRLIEWREGHLDAELVLADPSVVVTALAATGCMVLVGWANGEVHRVHSPCDCRRTAWSMRGECGTATRAVALANGVCAAALRSHVDLWSDGCSRRVCLGAPVLALCMHDGILFAGAGRRVAVWDVQGPRLVGTLAQRDGAATSLGVYANGIIGTTRREGVLDVWQRRAPMRLEQLEGRAPEAGDTSGESNR